MSTRLFSAGYNGPRLCRGSSSDTNGSTFAEVTSLPKTVSLFACGWKFNIFYTSDGAWYGVGENDKRQFGDAIPNGCTSTPIELPWLNSIVPSFICCGDKFTAILSTQGDVFVMGENCGNTFTKLDLPIPIYTIAAGTNNLVAVPRGKGIFLLNSMGSTPIFWSDNVQFIDCAAGKAHYIAISDRGVVYTWGKGKGCGQGKRFRSEIPVQINFPGQLTFSRCFAYNFSSFIVDSAGHLYAAGLNDKGQLGLAAIRKSNAFLPVKSSINHQIVFIALGDNMSYALDSSGAIFSCGDSADCRLMRPIHDQFPSNLFNRCTEAEDYHVDWVSAGCSHVILGVNMIDLIAHPVKKFSMTSVPKLIKSVYFNNLSASFLIDSSIYSFSTTGLQSGDQILKKGTSKKFTFLGVSAEAHQLIALNGESEVIHISFIQFSSIFLGFELWNKVNSVLQPFTTRGGIEIVLDVSPDSNVVHGLVPSEKVSSVFGSGVFLGSLGGAPWFKWDNEEASMCRFPTLKQQFAFLELVMVMNRDVTLLEIDNIPCPVEINPCRHLNIFSLQVHDFVTDGSNYYQIVGQFGHKAVLQPSGERRLVLKLPSSLTIVRRYDKENHFLVSRKSISSVVKIDVSWNDDDKLRPLDRIITKKGFATVVGKCDDGFYVQLDDLFVLDAGVVKLNHGDQYQFISHYENDVESFYSPGDVILHDERFLILTQKSSKVFRCLNIETLHKVDLELDKESDPIIYSPYPMKSRWIQVKGKLLCKVDVSLNLFRGKGLKPGDIVETLKGVSTVIGYFSNSVWFLNEKMNEMYSLAVRACVQNSIVSMQQRLGMNMLF